MLTKHFRSELFDYIKWRDQHSCKWHKNSPYLIQTVVLRARPVYWATGARWNYLSGAVTPLISLSRRIFVYSEQVRTLWTRCKLVILNVFIGQFWIFGHSGGGLELEKIGFFGRKIVFFTRNTKKMFAPPSAQRNFFKCAPPNLKSWIRPWFLTEKHEKIC
jgi:hypothetical protein